jgi:hypothetical protein
VVGVSALFLDRAYDSAGGAERDADEDQNDGRSGAPVAKELVEYGVCGSRSIEGVEDRTLRHRSSELLVIGEGRLGCPVGYDDLDQGECRGGERGTTGEADQENGPSRRAHAVAELFVPVDDVDGVAVDQSWAEVQGDASAASRSFWRDRDGGEGERAIRRACRLINLGADACSDDQSSQIVVVAGERVFDAVEVEDRLLGHSRLPVPVVGFVATMIVAAAGSWL